MSEHKLQAEVRAAQILKSALLEYEGEPDLIADMIEGETGLHEAIGKVLDGVIDDEGLLAGIAAITSAYADRAKRIADRVIRRRNAIERAMSVGELTKLELPQATLSLRRVPPKLHIVSEATIPDSFWVPQPPKLDRGEIAAAIKAGHEVPGAALDNGSTTLAIRRA